MTMIKEYYIKEFSALKPGVETAFRWRLESLPRGEKLGSLTFVVCATVAFLGSLCFAGAAFLGAQLWLVSLIDGITSPALPPSPVLVSFLTAVGVFVVALLFFSVFYTRALNSKKERKTIKKAEKTLDQ